MQNIMCQESLKIIKEPKMPIECRLSNLSPMTIEVEGEKYQESKRYSVNHVAMFMDRDLNRVRNRYLGSQISLTVRAENKNIENAPIIEVYISSIGHHCGAAMNSEVEQVLWSYNRQMLIELNGGFVSFHQRFKFKISHSEAKQVKNRSYG